MPTNADLQPDDLEVMQADQTGPEPTVRVVLAEAEVPVRVQEMPRKAGTTRTYINVPITPFQILRADHRRAKATLVSVGQHMYVGLSDAAGNSPDINSMALWPQLEPCPITATCDIWVASATSTTSISYITELWATGE